MNAISQQLKAQTAALMTAQTGSSSQTDASGFSKIMAQSQSASSSTGVEQGEIKSDNDATEDRFLSLLVAQMRNQDPMNPLENAEVTTQLAQINTVRGIEGLGNTMKDLLSKFDNDSPVDASQMLGRQVLLPGNTLTVTDQADQNVIGGAYVPSSTNAVSAHILSKDGEVVRRIDLGPQAAGVATFEWDGTDDDGNALDAGQYQLQLMGTAGDGIVDLQPLAGAQVTGVLRGDSGINYRVEGGLSVPADEVLGIF